jgi:8-amino-7-oxononanoate synthase
MPLTWAAWAEQETASIHAAGRWRTVRDLDGRGPTFALDGQTVVSFASNDYLGLTQHPAVIAAAHAALDAYGTGSGSARLIVGGRPIHTELEQELASWRGQERAVLFPTGYAANLGAISALAGPDVTVCSDELNHASIIDGCRLSRAQVVVYPHRDLDHLDRVLSRAGRAIVVTDTVFSMTATPSTSMPSCPSRRATAPSSSSTRPTPCSDRACRRTRLTSCASGRSPRHWAPSVVSWPARPRSSTCS